jgi:hypothetical protein
MDTPTGATHNSSLQILVEVSADCLFGILNSISYPLEYLFSKLITRNSNGKHVCVKCCQHWDTKRRHAGKHEIYHVAYFHRGQLVVEQRSALTKRTMHLIPTPLRLYLQK